MVRMDKKELRQKVQNRLLAITPEQRAARSHKACENLVSTSEFEEASAIMIFLSLPHEVDTSEAILHAWQLEKAVAVPKISWEQRHMIPVQINSLDTGFSTGASGLRNPITGVPMPLEEIDLVVAPGLAFDRSGNRLGRGAGYYDSFFAHEALTARRCGFAFSEQVIDLVPTTDTDEAVEFVITDEEIIICNEKGV